MRARNGSQQSHRMKGRVRNDLWQQSGVLPITTSPSELHIRSALLNPLLVQQGLDLRPLAVIMVLQNMQLTPRHFFTTAGLELLESAARTPWPSLTTVFPSFHPFPQSSELRGCCLNEN